MTKQEITAKYSHVPWSDQAEEEWVKAPDERVLHPSTKWAEKMCCCGNSVWCGRDSHRPSYAINPETNETFEFEE